MIARCLRNKGVRVASGTVLQKEFYEDHQVGENNSWVSTNKLWISNGDIPPQYMDEDGISTVFLTYSSP